MGGIENPKHRNALLKLIIDDRSRNLRTET